MDLPDRSGYRGSTDIRANGRVLDAANFIQDAIEAFDLSNTCIRLVDGTILVWCHGNEVLYGWKSDEAVGLITHDLLQTHFPLPLDQINSQLLQCGRWNGELSHRTKAGKEVWVASHWILKRNSDGTPRAVIEVNNEITDLKRAEQALLRSNSQLEQFAYAAAHDLQEPLRNISLSVDMAKTSAGELLSEETRSLMQDAIANAAQMRAMIRDVLVLSKAQYETTASSEVVTASDALRSALFNLAAAVSESQAQITWDRLPTVSMARTHLVQIFQNLIGNSLKHRDAATPEIHIGANVGTDVCEFYVRDNGTGIDPQYHDKVFGLFKRINKRSGPGTGIGLALCKQVIESYGGAVRIESDGKRGTTVFFTAPRAAELSSSSVA